MLKKLLMAFISTIVALGGMAVVTVSPAQAAPACTYNGCAGKDPNTTGCANDATNWRTFTNNVGDYLELRHSPSCHAVWTRMTVTSTCDNRRPTLETGYIDYYGTYHLQGFFQRAGYLCYDGPKTGWTPMSSDRRERITFGSNIDGPRVTYLTGCNDCYKRRQP